MKKDYHDYIKDWGSESMTPTDIRYQGYEL